MIFSENRDDLRRMYAGAWRKHVAGEPMSALEAQIAAIVEAHPEYRYALDEDVLERDFTPEQGETNPFLHMGLHLALREQVATDRPAGIRDVYRSLAKKGGDTHAAEHRMMEVLAETLWEAQRDGDAPDEQAYLERLRRL